MTKRGRGGPESPSAPSSQRTAAAPSHNNHASSKADQAGGDSAAHSEPLDTTQALRTFPSTRSGLSPTAFPTCGPSILRPPLPPLRVPSRHGSALDLCLDLLPRRALRGAPPRAAQRPPTRWAALRPARGQATGQGSGKPVRLCTLGGAFHVGERQAHFRCIPGALQAPQVQKLAKTQNGSIVYRR